MYRMRRRNELLIAPHYGTTLRIVFTFRVISPLVPPLKASHSYIIIQCLIFIVKMPRIIWYLIQIWTTVTTRTIHLIPIHPQ